MIINMQSCCASCVAYENGCCCLSDLPTADENVCLDYSPVIDNTRKTTKNYGR